MTQKRILVTGGTGFLGAALVKRLVKDGHTVRVIDNNWRGKSARLTGLEKKVEFIAGDIRDGEKVTAACEGIETVFHLAFVNGTEFFYSQPELVLEVGVLGMMNVLKGCRAHHVPELFTASSSEVYQTPPNIPTDESAPLSVPDPLNPRYSYGGGKIISELLTINYGRKDFSRVVLFRPHNVYGADMGSEHVIPQLALRLKDLKKAKKGKFAFPIQGSGKETRAFVFIDDFIDGLAVLLAKGQHLNIYHVGNDEEVSIATLAKEIAKVAGCDIDIQPGPLTAGSTMRRCPDISKLKALGYRPKVNLQEGLKKTVPWYLAHEADGEQKRT